MGLFSSKKKEIVNTTVQQMFKEEDLPHTIKLATIRAILNGGGISEYVMEDSLQSIGVKAGIAYNWAKFNYGPGIPIATSQRISDARSIVLLTLSNAVGQTITADYVKFGPLNSIHFGWQKLVDTYEYNPLSNEIIGLTREEGFPCYLKDMVATYQKSTYDSAVQYSDMGVFEQWGPAPSSGYTPENPFNTLQSFGQYAAQSVFEVSTDSTFDYVTVTYEFIKKEEVPVIVNGVQTGTETKETLVIKDLVLSLAPYNMDADYHQVRYKLPDNSIHFFTYLDGAGEYPEIDDVYKTQFAELGTYIPWTYFRYAGTNRGDKSLWGTDEYKQYVKFCKFMGIDYQTIADGVDADPDVGDVEQAILMFAVNPGATSQVEQEYLFEYFNLMYSVGAGSANPGGLLTDQFSAFTTSPTVAQVIQDRKFAIALVHSGISKKRISGVIGDIGTFTGKMLTVTTESEYDLVNSDRGPQRETQTVSTPTFVYQKQVLPSVYEEIQVYNPGQVYQITGKSGAAAHAGDPELLIPLDKTIVDSITFRKREELLTRAMYMVVNTKIVVKTKWYQSGWFKAVMIIISIVIIVLSWGSLSGAVAAAWQAGMTAVAILVVQTVVTSIIISYAVKMFVKAVGPEAGLFLAVIAIAYGGYSSYGAAEGTAQAVWSDRLLMLGNNLASATSDEYGRLIKAEQKDILGFQDYANQMMKDLDDKTEDLLGTKYTGGVSGLEFVSYAPMEVFGEAPGDFYNRTIHSGNIGTIGFTAVTEYYNNALRLPTLNDVNEDFNNGTV